jgi:hypothetical protein
VQVLWVCIYIDSCGHLLGALLVITNIKNLFTTHCTYTLLVSAAWRDILVHVVWSSFSFTNGNYLGNSVLYLDALLIYRFCICSHMARIWKDILLVNVYSITYSIQHCTLIWLISKATYFHSVCGPRRLRKSACKYDSILHGQSKKDSSGKWQYLWYCAIPPSICRVQLLWKVSFRTLHRPYRLSWYSTREAQASNEQSPSAFNGCAVSQINHWV